MPKIELLHANYSICVPDGYELKKLPEKDPESPFKFGCRNGHCGTCIRQVVEGGNHLTKMSEEEKNLLLSLKKDPVTHRLVCQCAVNGDAVFN